MDAPPGLGGDSLDIKPGDNQMVPGFGPGDVAPPGLGQTAQPGQMLTKPTPSAKPGESKTKIPGSLNKYERNWLFQLIFVLFLFGIAVGNVFINFEMIRIYEDLIVKLDSIQQPDESVINDMLDTVNASGGLEDLECDVLFFSSSFNADELGNILETILRIVKASTYLTVGISLPLTFLIKVISSYSIVNDDFNVVATEDLMKSAARLDEKGNAVKQPKFDLIKTKAVANSLILESRGEKKIRVFLRSETLLFGFNQLVQDIPQGTAAVLFILFLIRERGLLCYEQYSQGVISKVSSVDAVDNIALAQIAIIIFSMFVNVLLNLAPRWVKYFHHQTVKTARKPTSTSIRVFQISAWLIGYFLGIMLPVFAVLYSPLGTEVFGVDTSESLVILIVILVSAFSFIGGMFLICCFWGAQFGEQLCVCAVVVEAGSLGCEACCEVEACTLATDACC